MRRLVVVGFIAPGTTTRVMRYDNQPGNPPWTPEAELSSEPDYDLLRKQRIEAELAAADRF